MYQASRTSSLHSDSRKRLIKEKQRSEMRHDKPEKALDSFFFLSDNEQSLYGLNVGARRLKSAQNHHCTKCSLEGHTADCFGVPM